MFKNLFILFFLFLTVVTSGQDLKQIRSKYPEAVQSIEITEKLDGQLADVNSARKPVLLAYKGSILTLKAKFSKSKNEKKEFFKDGVSMIETAIKADSANIEIRYLRLSVQENAPKVLKYYKNIDNDKKFILDSYSDIRSMDLKEIVKDYILKSVIFDENEKSLLRKS